MNTKNIQYTLLYMCVLLLGLQYISGAELRCLCVNYYGGIPWTAKCVYLKPKSVACNQYELIVYNGSETKTCVRVRNSTVFEKYDKVTWFKVTKGKGKQISLKQQLTSCSVVQ
nr:protein UL146 [synthetic construct]AXG22151.1 protein UL146 [synthetic construct]